MREDQQAKFVPVMTGDYDVERQVREVLQGFKSNIGCSHPCPTHELKIFCDAAIETEASIRI